MKNKITFWTYTFGYVVLLLSMLLLLFAFGANAAKADYDITTGDGTYDNTGFIGYSDTYDKGAQSFLTIGAGTLETVRIKASVAGSGTYTMTLEADDSGHPSGAPLANVSFSGAIAAGCSDSVDVSFASPISLDAATTYWIVFDRDDANSTGNYLDLCSVGSDTYSDGIWKRFNTSAWSTISDDGDLILPIVEGGGGEGSTTPTTTPNGLTADPFFPYFEGALLWIAIFAFWFLLVLKFGS